MSPTVIVLRALGLGELVTGLPALHLLRECRPDHRIVLAAPKRRAPLVEPLGLVDDIVDTPGLTPPPAAPRRADLAIDLHGNGPASCQILAALEPRHLIAYAAGSTAWDPHEHEVERWKRLLREELRAHLLREVGVPGVLGPPPSGTPDGRTVVYVGADGPGCRWEPARFSAVALLLAAEGHDVVVTGSPGDEQLARSVAVGADVPVAHGLGLLELAHLVGTARLVVSGDTGVAQLAAAYERPSVTLFGPGSAQRWGPPDHPRHQALQRGARLGEPRGDMMDPALVRIMVGDVVAAAHAAVSASTVPA